jgi:hypothetical protein
MYYSYVEIEYVALSFSPARTDLAVKLLNAKSVLAGEKLVLFGMYVLNLYIGIVPYILREPKTRRAKIYLPTQHTNWRIFNSAKKIRF